MGVDSEITEPFGRRVSVRLIDTPGAFDVALTDELIFVDSSAGAITLTLPPVSRAFRTAAGIKRGRGSVFYIKRVSGTPEPDTCVAAGTDTIDGASDFELKQKGDFVLLLCGPNEWAILGSK